MARCSAGPIGGGVTALAIVLLSCAATAQERADQPFLIINQERLLTESEAGRALLAEEEAARDALRAEARSIDSAFEAEERALTAERPDLEREDFRRKSDDFDERVVQARRDQDARSNALAREFDQRRRQFYASIAPILVGLMDRYGALAILDENSVLLADQQVNITEAAIAEIDKAMAEGKNGNADNPGRPP